MTRMVMLGVLLICLGASPPADVQRYVAQMNAERARCGAPALRLDSRLQQVAEARLRQVFVEFSHFPNGQDPRPDLLRQAGFPVGPVINYRGEWQTNTSEGLVLGGYDPAGTGIPNEQYPHEPTWKPRRFTHHNDLINPRWTMTGHAFGSHNGVAYSVTIYRTLP